MRPSGSLSRVPVDLARVKALVNRRIRSGDDGTRTRDFLLANTPDPDGGGRRRTTLADHKRFVDSGGRQRTAADARPMFDRVA
jgi:hypothetical protein